MTTRITMPQLGESVSEGTVGRWLKQEGETIKRDEPLVEIITDKVTAEYPSPVTGRVVKILVKEDETVKVGAEIAEIEEAGATASARSPTSMAASSNAPALSHRLTAALHPPARMPEAKAPVMVPARRRLPPERPARRRRWTVSRHSPAAWRRSTSLTSTRYKAQARMGASAKRT